VLKKYFYETKSYAQISLVCDFEDLQRNKLPANAVTQARRKKFKNFTDRSLPMHKHERTT
jgi:hypothetical protein